jgi:hypothetical protein
MAKQEHLDVLKQGTEPWNQWRREHPRIASPKILLLTGYLPHE